MNYILSPSAENDLLEIWDYSTNTWGDAQADRYLKRLESRFIDLAANPAKGKQCNKVALDYLSYREAKHIIFYRQHGQGIVIARILHERMDVAERFADDMGFGN